MPLGTAGPVKKAEKLLGHDEPFIVLNGDIFADLNYRELFNAHVKAERITQQSRFAKWRNRPGTGLQKWANGNLIKRFIEKPPKDSAPSNLINAGVYILSPKVFDYIPSGRPVSVEREVFPKLAEEGKLYGHFVNGLWIDIGKPEEYLETNKIILDHIS